MKITFMVVGRTTTPYLRDAAEEYLQRAGRYMPVEHVVIPDVKASKKTTSSRQKDAEGMEILARLKNDDRVVLLDERGKEYTSRAFAGMIEEAANGGLRNLVFIVGGPYGFSQEVYARANAMISLSRMTFPHELVRLFFAEQLYRAMTIMRGEPYHHD